MNATYLVLKRPVKRRDRADPLVKSQEYAYDWEHRPGSSDHVGSAATARVGGGEGEDRRGDLRAGVSVSLVARQHGVAPNQVFKWRQRYAERALSAVGAAKRWWRPPNTGICSTRCENCNGCWAYYTYQTGLLQASIELVMVQHFYYPNIVTLDVIIDATTIVDLILALMGIDNCRRRPTTAGYTAALYFTVIAVGFRLGLRFVRFLWTAGSTSSAIGGAGDNRKALVAYHSQILRRIVRCPTLAVVLKMITADVSANVGAGTILRGRRINGMFPISDREITSSPGDRMFSISGVAIPIRTSRALRTA